jgi:type IV pilus assembly protein PilY1
LEKKMLPSTLTRSRWWRATQSVLLPLLLGLQAAPALAEDIDIYTFGGAQAGAPNVLFLLDNSANWSNQSQAWNRSDVLAKCGGDARCQRYVEEVFGTASNLTQGQVEVRALKLVTRELICADTTTALSVNIGLMLLSADKGNIDGTDNSWTGGWLLHAVSDRSRCSSLLAALDRIDANITAPAYKSSQDASYGGALFDVFKYFGGNEGPSGRSEPRGITGYGPNRYTGAYNLEDAAAFTDAGKRTYRSPVTETCGRNFLVVVGNTFPKLEAEDRSSPVYDKMLKNLGYASTGQVETSPATPSNKMRYADEWTLFLNGSDVSSLPDRQNITTYTINVYNNRPDEDQRRLLSSMARTGGGSYFEVGGDLGALIDSIRDIFRRINAQSTVFASASLPVSVNTQGTFLNQVFVGMFRPDPEMRPRWWGNVKQYQLALDQSGNVFLADRFNRPAVDNAVTGFFDACATSFWSSDSGTYWNGVGQTPPGSCTTTTLDPYSDAPDGNIVQKGGAGQAQRAASPGGRIVKTCTDAACSSVVDFNTTSATALAGSLGLAAPSSDLVNWIRGQNTGDGPAEPLYEFNGKASTATRPTVHGDVVHARPLAINYGRGDTNDVVLYYGAGDGLLRALDANQSGTDAGQEQWSFLAPEFLGRLNRLRENSPRINFPNLPPGESPPARPKDYFFDGSIGAYQERRDGAISRVYLYPTMRRGGRQVYAFDATNRPRAGTESSMPTLMWKFGCPNLDNDTGCTPGASAIGQTWSAPRVIRVLGHDTLYLVFGGGYDRCEDGDSCAGTAKGSSLFVLNARTGALVTRIDLGAKSAEAGRVIADVVPVDVSGDGYADVLYAVDTRGNLWRTSLSDPSATTPYTGHPASNWDARTYRIAKVADWSVAERRRKFQYAPDVVVLGGTANVFIGTGDREKPLPGSTASRVKNRFYAIRDNYAEGAYGSPSAPVLIDDSQDCDGAGDVTLDTGCQLLNVSALSADLNYNTALSNPQTRGWVMDLNIGAPPYEQVVTTPVVAGGVVYFSTFQPNAENSNSCSNLGTARGYAVDFQTGGLRRGDLDRASEFVGGGFPPSPVAGIVQIGDRRVPIILGGRQRGTGSALEGSRIPIDVNAIRRKVYRFEKIDR